MKESCPDISNKQISRNLESKVAWKVKAAEKGRKTEKNYKTTQKQPNEAKKNQI